MTVYYEEEGAAALPLECRRIAEEVIEKALDTVGCPYEAEVSLLLTTNDQIQEMNMEFRGIDRPFFLFLWLIIPPRENSDSLKTGRIVLTRNQESCLLVIS